MKKSIIMLAFMVFCVFISESSAQWYVGGGVSMENSNSEDEYSSTKSENLNRNFSFNPQVGYFLNDNFVLGLGVNYYNYKYKWSNTASNESISKSTTTNNRFTIEPFIRYHIPLAERVSFFNHFGVYGGFLNSERISESSNDDYKDIVDGKGSVLGFNYYPGFSFEINSKLKIDVGIGYLSFDSEKVEETPKSEYLPTGDIFEEDKSTENSTSFGVSYNRISLGLSYKF